MQRHRTPTRTTPTSRRLTALPPPPARAVGPIQLADYIGLDTCHSIMDGWVKEHPEEAAFFVPPSLKQRVAEGKLGRKTGEGYYKWDGDKLKAA